LGQVFAQEKVLEYYQHFYQKKFNIEQGHNTVKNEYALYNQ